MESARAALIFWFSFSMIPGGVALGRQCRTQLLASKPGTNSPTVWTSGSAHRSGDRQRAEFGGLDALDRRGRGGEVYLHLPGEQVGERGRSAARRHVNHVDASHHLEPLADESAISRQR